MGLPYSVRYLAIIFVIYQKGRNIYFHNKNVIPLMRVEKGQKVNWAHIIFNNLCSEPNWWYKYVKDNKGEKKNTYQSALVLAKIFWYLFVHQKENPQKPPTKVKRIKEEL
jgi:hypothetical protein